MPLYNYRCENKECDHIIEKIVKYSQRDVPHNCEKCNGEQSMKLEVFTPGEKGASFDFRGNWFNTTGRY